MNLFVKFDYNTICNKVLEEQLKKFDVKYIIKGFGEVKILETLTTEKQQILEQVLLNYGITIIENQKNILVQKIKDCIVEMVFGEEANNNIKSSVYLSEKIGHSYGYLSNIFSEFSYSSIENFIIIQKIEFTKQLIINDQLSLTEIAFKLNYSSVAHLSTQFKNTTGINPSAFQRIIKKRKEIANNTN